MGRWKRGRQIGSQASRHLQKRFGPLLRAVQDTQNGNSITLYMVSRYVRGPGDYQFTGPAHPARTAHLGESKQHFHCLNDAIFKKLRRRRVVLFDVAGNFVQVPVAPTDHTNFISLPLLRPQPPCAWQF